MTEELSSKPAPPPRMAAFGAIIDMTAQLPPAPDHVERLALHAAEMKDLISFADLNLPDDLRRGIEDLGFVRTTPIQSVALPEALRGRDVLGQAQTGTGKTATFLLTIFKELLETERNHPTAPRAVVIAPTRELALQITDDAEGLSHYTDISTVAVFGGMDWEKQARRLEDPIDLLVATPGRLMDYCKRGLLSLNHIQVLVVDEADRMFDMGFIQDIKWIVGQCPADRQTLMFSATFPFEVTRLAQRFQRNPLEVRVQPEQVAANTIEQLLYHVAEFEKLQFTLWLLEHYKPKRCLIFINTKRTGDWLNFKLWNNGWESGYISGDLPQRKRMKLVEDFREGNVEVMVATDVAARGLHIDDVDLVINFEIPADANDYVHRIGRTGRAGNAGRAITIADERLVQHLPEIERLLGHQLDAKVPEDDQYLRDKAPSYRAVVLSTRPKPTGGRSSGKKAKPEIWSPPTQRDSGEATAAKTTALPNAASVSDESDESDEGQARKRKRKRKRTTGQDGQTSGEDAPVAAEGAAAAEGDAGSESGVPGADAAPAADGIEGAARKRRRRGGRRRGKGPKVEGGEAAAGGETEGGGDGGASDGGDGGGGGGGDDAGSDD